MGNRIVLLLKIVVLAVLAVAAGAWLAMRATTDLDPRPPVVVLDQPGTMAGTAAKRPADFTVIDPPRPAPDTPFLDGEGRSRSLADFRGKVVLLNLWATWCGPCVAEMPALDRLQAALGGADFEVVALSQDRQGLAVVTPFDQKQGITRLAAYADARGAMADALEEKVLPVSLLIDRAGRIVGRLVGAADWEAPEWIALLRRAIDAPAPAGS